MKIYISLRSFKASLNMKKDIKVYIYFFCMQLLYIYINYTKNEFII